ncbi:conserved hypothetical protein [Tenacibaculum sp. 190524A02b]|uniref:Tape measure protein N-terminal domain-containing protein n=1 Tax=Tenacibaculum vairaonense TaxID=3137860 RepID=A0ABP1FCU2_9FLAO
MQSYGYTVFLKDLMSSKYMKIAATAQKSYTKINKMQQMFQNKTFQGAKSINGLNKKLEELNEKRGAATSVKSIKKLNQELKKTKNTLHKLENLPPTTFLDRLRKARKNLGGISTAAITGIGVMGAFNGIKSLYNLGADAEASRLKFETLLGSMDKAKRMIENINQYANVTPFNNKDLKRNAELLLQFGISQSKILPTLKVLGDISGGNKEKLNSMSLAYAQMTSAGKLNGQDLLQMINAGFNPLQVISEKTGKSMADLKDQMSKGAISSKMVEAAFVSATQKGGRFHGMLKKMSTSSKGLASTLVGGFQTKIANFSEKYFLPLVNKLLSGGLKLVENLEKLEPPVLKFFRAFKPLLKSVGGFISRLIGVNKTGGATGKVISYLTGLLNGASFVIEIASNGIGTLLNVLKPLAPVLKIVGISILSVKSAMWLWNVAMWANPIMLVVGGLTLLIGGIVTAYKKIAWFRGGILAAWQVVKGFGTIIKDYVVNRIVEMVKGITGIGKTLYLFFTGQWKKAWETGKQSVGDLIGVGSTAKAIAKAKKVGKNAGKAYANALSKSKAFKAIEKTKKVSKTQLKGNNPQSLLSSDSELKKGITSITGGGSKQTNIQVHFNKMVENVNFHTQNINEGFENAQEDLKEMLLGVLNSINQMQTT